MIGHHTRFQENGDLLPWRGSAAKKKVPFLMCALMTHEIMHSRDAQCNVLFQKISILPPHAQKGLEFPGGWGGSARPKNLKKCMTLNWNFRRGGGSLKKSLPWGRYGYFLELHNTGE